MEHIFPTMLLLSIFSFFLYVYLFSRGKKYSGRIPPGSLGLPLVGQNIEIMKAIRADKLEGWFQEGIAKYGPVWKANIFGSRTVILHGLTANKFLLATCENEVIDTQPPIAKRVFGPNNITGLTRDNHKRVRSALVSFLKVDVLKQYVAKVDEEIQHHLHTHWHGQNEIQVQPLMKTLTFDVISSLLFGIERGPKREQFVPLFQEVFKTLVAIPVDLPFTTFNRGLKTRKKLTTLLVDLLNEKREALNKQKLQTNPHKDLIISLLNIDQDNDSLTMLSDEEIIDTIIFVMAAGYDTTSVLITFLVRLLANNESIYSNVAQEQEEISENKAPGEALTWEDLTKMKYTWRVASEMLRIIPPANVLVRRFGKDIEYGGYIIPKGWQVLVCANMTHMDDSIFPNATMFDPARFDKHTPPPPFSLLAFGAGPRMCPGMELAKMETLAIIHRLVTMFKWELVKKDESFKRNFMPEFDQGLLVRIKPIKRDIRVI